MTIEVTQPFASNIQVKLLYPLREMFPISFNKNANLPKAISLTSTTMQVA
jgi:hypothetical protein